MFFLALKVLHLFSLKKGWGSRTVWVCFWFLFWVICVLKQHEMLPVFRFCVFVGCLGFLFVVFRKVLLGLGFCLDKFGVDNCSPLIGPSCALVLCCKQHEMLPVFLFCFFRGDLVFLIACFWKSSSWLRVLFARW